MLNWLSWAIPQNYVRRYLFTLWLVLFILPGYVLGLQFTKFGGYSECIKKYIDIKKYVPKKVGKPYKGGNCGL